MLPELVAYYAGLFDGEGCVYLNRNAKRWGCFTLSASVVMTDPIALKKLLRDFGGSFSTSGRQQLGHRQPYKWMAKAQKAASFLRTIRPYTLVKSEQIDVALEFQARLSSFQFRQGTGRRLPIEEKQLRDEYWQRLKDLKRLVVQEGSYGIAAKSGNPETGIPNQAGAVKPLACVETMGRSQVVHTTEVDGLKTSMVIGGRTARQEIVQSNGN